MLSKSEVLGVIRGLSGYSEKRMLAVIADRLEEEVESVPNSVKHLRTAYKYMTWDEVKKALKMRYDVFMNPEGHKLMFPKYTEEHPALDSLVKPVVDLAWEIPTLIPQFSCEGHDAEGFRNGRLVILTASEEVSEELTRVLPKKAFFETTLDRWTFVKTLQAISIQWSHLDKVVVLEELERQFRGMLVPTHTEKICRM